MINQNRIRFKSDYTREETCPYEKENFFDTREERLMSIEEIADLRMNNLCTGETDVKGGVLYTSEGPVITKSYLPLQPEIHQGIYCGPTSFHPMWESRKDLEYAFRDAIKVRPCIVPSDRLSEDEVMSFLFGIHTKSYGELLVKKSIPAIELLLNTEFLNIREDPKFHKVYLGTLRFGKINYKSTSVLDGSNVFHPMGSYRLEI